MKVVAWQIAESGCLGSSGIVTDPHGTCCLVCFNNDESCSQGCRCSKLVWDRIQGWLGISVDTYVAGVDHYHAFRADVNSKKSQI